MLSRILKFEAIVDSTSHDCFVEILPGSRLTTLEQEGVYNKCDGQSFHKRSFRVYRVVSVIKSGKTNYWCFYQPMW